MIQAAVVAVICVGWAACGVVSYGLMQNYWRTRFPTLEHGWKADAAMALGGPLDLAATMAFVATRHDRKVKTEAGNRGEGNMPVFFGGPGGGSAMPFSSVAHPAVTEAMWPKEHLPNTLGWRSWHWDMTAGVLMSPIQATAWNGPELRCEAWDEGTVVRGHAGIHAKLAPVNWADYPPPELPSAAAVLSTRGGTLAALVPVHGIVERFGKYVLGEDGWRAEWVVIRKLRAPTEKVGLQLEAAFPDVEVVYPPARGVS